MAKNSNPAADNVEAVSYVVVSSCVGGAPSFMRGEIVTDEQLGSPEVAAKLLAKGAIRVAEEADLVPAPEVPVADAEGGDAAGSENRVITAGDDANGGDK